MWSFLIKEKSEVFKVFKNFKAMVETEAGKTMKTFRTDRGGEFTSHEFQSYCEEKGLKRHLTTPYSPQQNGVVERRNRTLLEMTKSVMKAMKVPNYLWGEAVQHSTYILNRVYTRALKLETPYEKFKQKKPTVEHIKVFGCLAYARVDSIDLKKLDDRSRPLIHLGCEPGTKGYRLYNPQTRKVIISKQVTFLETLPWNWEKSNNEEENLPATFEVEWGTGGWDDENVVEDEDGSSSSETVDQPIAADETCPTGPGHDETDGPNRHQESQVDAPRSSARVTVLPRNLQHDYVLYADHECSQLLQAIDEVPNSYYQAHAKKEWIQAMNAELESINKNQVWTLVEPPPGVKPIGVKWLFKVKNNADQTLKRYKARLVAKGYVQQPGIDYEEAFALVARIETIRFLIALAAANKWEIYHLDVKTAFLYGELKETIYVTQPPGYEKKGEESKIYRLNR